MPHSRSSASAAEGLAATPSPSAGVIKGSSVTVSNVSFNYVEKKAGGQSALKDIDLHIQPGEFLTIVGPSGCGKSTLLSLIAGFSSPTTGEILVDGEPVTGPSSTTGFVFQQHRLFPWYSVRKNVEYGPRAKRLPKAQIESIASEALNLVGMSSFANRPSYKLSGGQKQRVAIARALAGQPHVLLMDEPFSALDALTRETLQEELIEIWRRTGITIIFVTHSIDEAVFLSSKTAVMSAAPGRILVERELNFSSMTDFRNSRSLPEFGVLRQNLSEILRDAASS
jgi:ABC-type nitrate/sulfonate/bicarbonate transport system ATPase subunit